MPHDETLAFALGKTTAYERDAAIHHVFSRHAARAPRAVAVRDDAASLTYGELEARSNRLAHRLLALGAGPGRAIGIALGRSPSVPVALLAILKTGGAYVPLDPSYPLERLEFMIEDASISLVLSERGLRARVPAATPCLCLDEAEAEIAAQSELAPSVACDAGAIAYVMYTSGSTGRPKGVAIPHRGVVRLVRGSDYLEVTPHDVFLHFSPLAFDASTFEIWGALLNGARLAIPEAGPLSMAELGRCLQRNGVTTLLLTAPLFRLMVESELQSLSLLRCLLTGGDVASAEHAKRFLEAFPACRLLNAYGPTENTTISCCYRFPAAEAVEDPVPIGRPIANSSAYVLDAGMRPLPAGEPGELCVGGDGLAREYVNLPELTAERFVADPFAADPQARLYRTGDRARFRGDGTLEFLGRLDLQVKIRGFRVEVEEIEHALRAHPGVAEAVVSAVVQDGEKSLYAHVLPAAPGLDERGLRRFLAANLPGHMVPTHVAVVRELVWQISGKVDRRAMAERAAGALAAPRPIS